jgi:hypothetical protein
MELVKLIKANAQGLSNVLNTFAQMACVHRIIQCAIGMIMDVNK